MAPSKHSSLQGIGICATNKQRHSSAGAKATGPVCLPAPLYLEPTVLEIEHSSTTTTNAAASSNTAASTWKGCTGISGCCSTPSPMSLENAQNNTDDHAAASEDGSCCCCCRNPTTAVGAVPGSPTITHTAMSDTPSHPRLPKCTCRRAAAALAAVANETKTDAGQAHHNSTHSGSSHTATTTTAAGSPAPPPTCDRHTNTQPSHTTSTTTTTLTSSNHKQTTTVSVSLLVQEGSPHHHHHHQQHQQHQQQHQQRHQQHHHQQHQQHQQHHDCTSSAVPVGHQFDSDAASSPSSSLLSPSPPSPSIAHCAQLFHTRQQHSTNDGTTTETDDDDSDDSDCEEDSESTTDSDSDDETFGDEDSLLGLGGNIAGASNANGDDDDDDGFALLMQPRLLIVQGPDVGGAATRCHSAPVQFTLSTSMQARDSATAGATTTATTAAATTATTSSTECHSRSEECRPPRTRVVRFSDAVVTVMEKQFSAELQRERSGGSLWLQLARDRLRFRRRAAEVSDLFAAARPRGIAYRRELAARTIQAAWRRYQCHCLGALRWINRQQSVEAPVLVRRPTLPLDAQGLVIRRTQSAAAPVAVPSSSATLPSSSATRKAVNSGGSGASLSSSTTTSGTAVCPVIITAISAAAPDTAAVCISLGVQGSRGPTVIECPQDWLCQGKGKHRRKGGRHASTSRRTPDTWADYAEDAMVDPEDE
eukprot:m.71644 g.71644  ORF g.71644 m.71644 type:complete len:705 (-) comp14198_c0_seq1:42-2156(-)